MDILFLLELIPMIMYIILKEINTIFLIFLWYSLFKGVFLFLIAYSSSDKFEEIGGEEMLYLYFSFLYILLGGCLFFRDSTFIKNIIYYLVIILLISYIIYYYFLDED